MRQGTPFRHIIGSGVLTVVWYVLCEVFNAQQEKYMPVYFDTVIKIEI